MATPPRHGAASSPGTGGSLSTRSRASRCYVESLREDLLDPANTADLDPHIRRLVFALNRLSGVATALSCEGHGKKPVQIVCLVADPESVAAFAEALDTAELGWTLRAMQEPGYFMLESALLGEASTGEDAYAEAAYLADALEEAYR